ncbi:MAG: hypothetical protein CR968_00400 [Flavobacteriia bacterium]|nr:MAG: hypothetical protein CR968_00400 [Flavobacteriia bacterium]
MKPHKIIIIWLLVVLLPINALSQTEDNKVQINGFVDTYHAMRTKSPNDYMSSRTRFRGEVEKAFGKSSMFVSFNLNQNSLLKERNGFELREAYFDYTASHWSLRAGRQLIIWGVADGMRITDLVSPMDMTEFLARDYDDIRMPVEALKFNYFRGTMKAELVYVPVFKGFILPTNPKNPWAVSMPAISDIPLIILEDDKPEMTLKNFEIGGRMVFNLPGIDFSLATLYTFNKMPVFAKTMQNNMLYIQPQYKRMTFVGGDFSKPLGQFVLRGEMAFNLNKHFSSQNPYVETVKRNTANYLIGVDWFAPSEWLLSVQFSDETVFNHSEDLEVKQHSPLLTFNVSKSIINSTLKLSDFVYADLQNEGFFSRFSADYALSDQIHVLGGYDHFEGDQGMFGFYKNNSEVWIKAKYSF